ncbi:hypothetical protein ACFLWZ_04925 [Chloroflexota bacterium]
MVDRNNDRGQQAKSQLPVHRKILRGVSSAGSTARGKETNGDSPAGSISITTGAAAIVTGSFQAEELCRLQTTIAKPTSLVPTMPMSVARRAMVRHQSSIIIMDDGYGKTTILDRLYAEMGEELDGNTELLDSEEWAVITDATHEDALVHELWQWMGAPTPDISEFKAKDTTGKRGPHYRQLRCDHCYRKCILMQVENNGGFGSLSFEDCDVQIGLERIGGCPLVRDMVRNNISEFKQDIAVEVPRHLSPAYLEILRLLAPNRTLLILCPPKAATALRETFPAFLVKTPERLSVDDLLAIYRQRLVDAGMVSPLPPQAVAMLALMSDGNTRRFIERVGDLVDKIQADGTTEAVSVAWVGNEIGREMGSDLAIQLALSFFRASGLDWISYTDLQKKLRATFRLRLTGTTLGKMLSDMGVEKERRGKKKVVGYYIGDFVMTNNQ